MKLLTALSVSLLAGVKLASAQCSPTGTGYCNLGLVAHSTGDDEVSWYAATIFNYECNVIGSYTNPYQGVPIDSQLPYTVDLTLLSSDGDYDYIGMAYAGYTYEGYFDCFLTNSGDVSCQHAFPC